MIVDQWRSQEFMMGWVCPSRLGGLEKRRKLPSGVWGEASTANAF